MGSMKYPLKEHFIEDFKKGYSRYYYSLLVNALLVLARRFSDRPSTRRNLDNGTTAGDTFFAEALKLYRTENNYHNLPRFKRSL